MTSFGGAKVFEGSYCLRLYRLLSIQRAPRRAGASAGAGRPACTKKSLRPSEVGYGPPAARKLKLTTRFEDRKVPSSISTATSRPHAIASVSSLMMARRPPPLNFRPTFGNAATKTRSELAVQRHLSPKSSS